MRLLLTVLFLTAFCLSGQSQSYVRVQNSFFLTGQPLFGIGYLHAEDGDRWMYGLQLEGGRYIQHEHDLINASWESYSISGLSLVPEVRFYLSSNEDVLSGLFLAGFTHVRTMREYTMDGTPAQGHYRRGYSLGGGLAAGYTVGCGDTPLFVELLAGYGRAHATWQSPALSSDARARAGTFDSATTLYRLELALAYRF